MFGAAAAQFADRMAEPYECVDPRELLVAGAHRRQHGGPLEAALSAVQVVVMRAMVE